MKCIAIVLARSDSTRLPRKHFREIGNFSMLEFIWRRLSVSRHINAVVLATTCRPIDDDLVKLAQDIGYDIFRGDLNDVLRRFKCAADFYDADLIVKVNGDSPFISASLIDEMLEKMLRKSMGFITAKSKYTCYPIGVGAEVIGKAALEELDDKTPLSFRESVTGFIFDANHDLTFEICSAGPSSSKEVCDVDLTIDTNFDLNCMRRLWSELAEDDPGDVSLDKLLISVRGIENLL